MLKDVGVRCHDIYISDATEKNILYISVREYVYRERKVGRKKAGKRGVQDMQPQNMLLWHTDDD